MIGFLYSLGLHLYALCALPKVIFQRKKLLTRLGYGFPQIKKDGRLLIWIHAVSLGETKAVTPLIKRLKALANPPQILLTTITETGFAEGEKIPEIDHHAFMPFDFSYVIRPIVKRVVPDLVILTETDFWLNFQNSVHEQGGSVVLVNGKVSERSSKRFSKVPFFSRKLFSSVDHFCVQGKLYAERFLSLGVSSDKITCTGNLKLDQQTNEVSKDKIDSLKREFGILPEHLVLTIGSTHEPEEKLLLPIFKELWKRFPHLKILLVPRHPDRFSTVETLVRNAGISYSRYSSKAQDTSLVLVDAMGVLLSCYQISDLALVGGSFTPKVGGHNILEPCFYGLPVLYGPYMHKQPDLVNLVQNYRAGLQVEPETLLNSLEDLLSSQEKRFEMGLRGRKLIEESKGSLDLTFETLSSYLNLA